MIIDLNDGSESPLREKTFITSDEEDEHHIRGCAELHSGTIICAEVYFHKEKDYERELAKHGEFTKKELGPVFVAYELTKK